jgi:tetratricopeptide (TPR) repeat protein
MILSATLSGWGVIVSPAREVVCGTLYAVCLVGCVSASPENLRGVERMKEHHSTTAETPEMLSLMGYSLATQSGRLKEGISLCEKAISLSPNQTEHYLNLGRIYLLARKKEHAIRVFKTALKIRKDPRIIKELQGLGVRKPPVVSSLSRDHVINVVAGKVLKILKLR